METIRGDIITQERKARRDVLMTESPERGGIEFRTLSYFDVLLDNKTISKPQYDYGRRFWALRDVARKDQGAKISKIEYVSECTADEELEAIDHAEEGMAEAVYRELCLLLHRLDNDILNACCYNLCANDHTNRNMIFRVFNEAAIESAFMSLERIFPLAEEKSHIRVENAKKPLQEILNMLNSKTDSHAHKPPAQEIAAGFCVSGGCND